MKSLFFVSFFGPNRFKGSPGTVWEVPRTWSDLKCRFETQDFLAESFLEIHAFCYIIFPPAKKIGGPKIMIFRNSKRYLQILDFAGTKSRGTQYNSSMKLFSRTIPQKNPRIVYQLSDPGNLGELSGNLSYLSQVWFEVKYCHFFSPKWCFATRNNTIFSFEWVILQI